MTMTTAKKPTETARAGDSSDETRRLATPRCDIFEDADYVTLVLDLPGVTADDIDVTVENRVLSISGRSRHQPPQGYRLVRAEYDDADYERSFTLSADISQDRIEAVHKKGVLQLRLPKAAEARARRIAVKTA
jgi:HSP20 family molecular chaperone IbpA